MYQFLLILAAALSPRPPLSELRLSECWPFAYDDPRAARKLSHAEYLFRERSYANAAHIFRRLAANPRNDTDLAERASFMHAECLRLSGDFVGAVEAYRELVTEFPTGIHRREACTRLFEIGMDWLDDFRGTRRWRLSYPRKPILNREARAVEVLELVKLHDLVGPHADEAVFWCGYVSFVRKDYEEAAYQFTELVRLYPDSRFTADALDMLYQIREKHEPQEREARMRFVRR